MQRVLQWACGIALAAALSCAPAAAENYPSRNVEIVVAYGAGGSTRERTHQTVKRILEETHLAPAAHLTCVDASKDEVDEVVRQYRNTGVRHFVNEFRAAASGSGPA